MDVTFDFAAASPQEEDQEENTKLDVIRSILGNMTSLLHNSTYENVSGLIPTLRDLVLTMKNHTMRLATL